MKDLVPRSDVQPNQLVQSDARIISRNCDAPGQDSSSQKIAFATIVDPSHEDYLKRTNLRSELERRKTFEKWPSYPCPYLANDLAKDGFFYLGNLDRTQCFCCSGVLRNWAPTDSVVEEHRKHFPNCRMHRGLTTGNAPMSESQRRAMDVGFQARTEQLSSTNLEPPDPSPEQLQRLAEGYVDIINTANPRIGHMALLQRRLETFDHRWPRNRIRASAAYFADAGLFFLGEGDKTKCFYCNGGLENWNHDDDPWSEHAKWFPSCDFVLRRKGIAFVQRFQTDKSFNDNCPLRTRNPLQLNSNSLEGGNSELSQASADINLEEVENMGFSRDMIYRATERSDRPFSSADDLVQFLLAHPESFSVERKVVAAPVVAAATTNSYARSGAENTGNKRKAQGGTAGHTPAKRMMLAVEPNAGSEITTRYHTMMNEHMCIKCGTSRREVVLMPCGHFCVCNACAQSSTECPICEKDVHDRIKVLRQ